MKTVSPPLLFQAIDSSSACYMVRISMTSPININVPTGALLDAETKDSFVRWLAFLNIKRNLMSMFVNRYLPYKRNFIIMKSSPPLKSCQCEENLVHNLSSKYILFNLHAKLKIHRLRTKKNLHIHTHTKRISNSRERKGAERPKHSKKPH